MATRGRKKTGAAKSSQERKAEFDKRMRNDDRVDPTAPVRSPSVFYISAAAKAVVSRNREILRLSKVSPMTDSEFLELLLLSYEAAQVAGTGDASGGGDAVAVGPSKIELRRYGDVWRARSEQLVKERNLLKEENIWLVELLRKAGDDDEPADLGPPFDLVYDAHRSQPSIQLAVMVQRLAEYFRASSDVRELARQVHWEIGDYLFLLREQ